MEDGRLKVFCAVAERLSFTQAAAALYLTQPAVTSQIAPGIVTVERPANPLQSGRRAIVPHQCIEISITDGLPMRASFPLQVAGWHGRFARCRCVRAERLALGIPLSPEIVRRTLPSAISALIARCSATKGRCQQQKNVPPQHSFVPPFWTRMQ